MWIRRIAVSIFAVLFLTIMWGNKSCASSESEELLQKKDIGYEPDVIVALDYSGSVKENALYHDLKLILYEMFEHDMSGHVNQQYWLFDMKCREETVKEKILGTSKKNTDLLNALGDIDSLRKNIAQSHGKAPYCIIISDFYDTSNEDRILDPEKDEKEISGRKERIMSMAEAWEAENTFWYALPSSKSEAKSYTQIEVTEVNWFDTENMQDSGEVKKECVKTAASVIYGAKSLKWETFDSIDRGDIDYYTKYFMYSNAEISFPAEKNDKVERIAEECGTKGYIYYVNGIPLSEFDFSHFPYSVDILNIPYVQIDLQVKNNRNGEKPLSVEDNYMIEVTATFEGEPVAGLSLYGYLGEKNFELQEEKPGNYKCYQYMGKSGNYDLLIFMKNLDGNRLIVTEQELIYEKKILVSSDFADECRKIIFEMKSGCIDMAEYVSASTEAYTIKVTSNTDAIKCVMTGRTLEINVLDDLPDEVRLKVVIEYEDSEQKERQFNHDYPIKNI